MLNKLNVENVKLNKYQVKIVKTVKSNLQDIIVIFVNYLIMNEIKKYFIVINVICVEEEKKKNFFIVQNVMYV